MTSLTAGDVLVNTLIDWGVDTVFGIPGDGINGLIELLRREKTKSAPFKSAMRRLPPSQHALMQNGPRGSGSASRLPGLAGSIS